MKKIISIIIAVLMMATLLCAAIPVSAADETPEAVLYLNGEELFDGPFAQILGFVQSGSLGSGNYKVKLNKNVQLTTKFNPKHANNIEIDGLLPNGEKAIINSTVTENNWRLEGGAKYVFRNVVLKGQATGGCMFQLNHAQNGGDLDLIDCVVESQDLYYTINAMATSGAKQTVNIVRTTITQKALVGESKVKTRAAIATSNPAGTYGQYMHLELNIIDSTIKSEAGVIWGNSGSTVDINLTNSILELLPLPDGVTAHERTYLPQFATVILDKVEELKNVPGLPTKNTLDAENSMIKAPAGFETIVTNPDCTNTEINYQMAEDVNPDVTTPETDLDVELGLPEITTLEPVETEEPTDDEADDTTPSGGEDDETTPADDEDDETTPVDDEADDTTPGNDETTVPAGDVTTAGDDAAAGGCAGCGGAGDPAVTTVAAIVIAMAAAVAIIVKRK